MRKSKYHFKFEDLGIYTKAMEFGEFVSKLIKNFPKEERFELTSQFKRAADSIALNIAEGSSGTDKQFYNYLGNAWHSAHECVSCSSKAQMRNYISAEEDEENRKLITELSKMITSLRTKISKRIK
ncbi:four helix bundle protein [Oceanihabitans sp. 2_MG-2023]|uniref:four helix bundle protein n=1 Tax=Oceanihabitans sp. 2_MG-2023 TaxID=3062661 RepID=UPI0026E36874|nr:four helix bundle protein [Oceanihabitans sp. 2_MG-2023]MDO6596094.1 four helix bundle protein [Oceanihabitans sp. 2_MG-2023]